MRSWKLLLISMTICSPGFTHAETSEAGLMRRVALLEQAFMPKTPEQLVNTFAKAVKERNGAVQYMLMCPSLQKKFLADFEGRHWVTGTSSPSISSFRIEKSHQHQYLIHFTETLQGKAAGSFMDKLEVSPKCISGYEHGDHVQS